MADPAAIPPAPADLVAALWIFAWIVGGIVVTIAGAFTTLGWYLVRRIEKSEKECLLRGEEREAELRAERNKSHKLTMAFVAALSEVASVLKDMRRDVREAIDPHPHEQQSDTSSGLQRAIDALSGHAPPKG